MFPGVRIHHRDQPGTLYTHAPAPWGNTYWTSHTPRCFPVGALQPYWRPNFDQGRPITLVPLPQPAHSFHTPLTRQRQRAPHLRQPYARVYLPASLLHTLPDPSLLPPQRVPSKRQPNDSTTRRRRACPFDVLVVALHPCTPHSQTALIVRQSTQPPSTLQVSRVYSRLWRCRRRPRRCLSFPSLPPAPPLHGMRFLVVAARDAVIAAQTQTSRQGQ